MSKRGRQRRRKQKGATASSLPAPLPVVAKPRWYRRRPIWIAASVLAFAVVVALCNWPTAPAEVNAPVQLAKNPVPADTDKIEPPDPDFEALHGHHSDPKPASKSPSENFLDEFNQEKTDIEKGSGTALADKELESRFQELVKLNDQVKDLEKREVSPGAFANSADRDKHDRLVHQFERGSAALDKATKQAAHARPDDAVPRWLTGELLVLIGGEPEEMLPHLKFALAHGLSRPRLFASVSLAYLEANQFADAYRYAIKAVETGDKNRYEWDALMHAAASTNHFDQVVERLDRTFAAGLPDWAKFYRHDAAEMQSQWAAEQKLRMAEARADDLPRVRLVIEHRHFAKGPDGQPLTTVESGGREEVIVELFENEAPNTVANFLDLVERKIYDGTRFHLAVSAFMVAGGDPNSKKEDPSADGTGGPGYVIPDECQSPNARCHFHGTLSMVNTGPGTGGSQFFFTLVPRSGVNGHFTVFGRIIQGEDVIDRITRGRTTSNLHVFGKIIPGDLLVRAEVIRKRPHKYEVIKGQR